MQWIRRAHMYSSLVMLPWVLLYAITGILFNHPTWFGDAPFVSYGPAELYGTPLEKKVDLNTVAARVVDRWNEIQPSPGVMKISPHMRPRYSRDYAFALAKGSGTETNLLYDVMAHQGTVRSQKIVPPAKETPAPFAMGKSTQANPRRTQGEASKTELPAKLLDLPEGLHTRFLESIPTILEKTKMKGGTATVTSVPDLLFSVDFQGEIWLARFNALQGTLQGKLLSEVSGQELSNRRLFLRLHTLHGYPGGFGPRWLWSFLADLVSLAMLFWVGSGVYMWWMVRSARWAGVILLAGGFSLAIGLALELWGVFQLPV